VTASAFAARLSAWRPPRDAVGIVALGQAGIALRTVDDFILIDPFCSPHPARIGEPVADPAGLVTVTAVLATHEHADHLDLPTWSQLAQASPAARFIVPSPLVPLVEEARIAGERVTGISVAARLDLGRAHVTAVPARHGVDVEDGYSLGDSETPRWVGYVVELGDVRLYHAGDTLADPAIVAAVAPLRPDVAFLPINGRDAARERRNIVGNMTPDEAARTAGELGVALAVPIHFETIRGNEGSPDAFVRAMREHNPSAAIWIPARGAAILWPAGPASWSPADG
jgi:L-ascorbate 6-phosphate lactonase